MNEGQRLRENDRDEVGEGGGGSSCWVRKAMTEFGFYSTGNGKPLKG